MIAVYIIKTHFDTYYTGITNSIIRRWQEHNKRKGKYLSKYKPKLVVFIMFVEDRKIARKIEVSIKNIGAKKFLFKNGYYV